MPTFAFEAVDDLGQLVRGRRDAQDERDLDELLSVQGLTLVRLRFLGGLLSSGGQRPARKVGAADLSELANYVKITFQAGLPVVDSIADFAANTRSSRVRETLLRVVEDVRGGATLADAFANQQGCFDETFLSLVRAGESSGSLEAAMKSAAEQMRFQVEVRGQIKQAMIQPCVTLLAVGGLVVMLLTFLFPRILGMLSEANVELPATSRFLMGVSDFLVGHGIALLVGLVVGGMALRYWSGTAHGRMALGRVLIALPVVGPLVRMGAEARFTSTMGTLLGSGVDAVRSMHMAADTAGSPVLAARMHVAAEQLAEGTTITEAIDAIPGLHPLVRRMLQLGEKAGDLEHALNIAVDYFSSEIPRRVKRAIAVLEPVIIAFSGLVVGFILLSALMPIFSLYESY